MFLYINGEKFHGENKKDCIIVFLKQPYTSGDDDKIIEEVYRRASEFIINCFLDLIESNPIKYRDIKFGE